MKNFQKMIRYFLYYAKKVKTYLLLIFVCFLTLEICARIDDKVNFDTPILRYSSPEDLRTVDEDGLRVNVPNTRYEKWHNNSQGFRGNVVATPKPPHVKRIACMGTSESYGLYEGERFEWPSQLESMFEQNELSHEFDVYNTSVVGLRFDAYQKYIDKYVVKYQPTHMILLINPFQFATAATRQYKKNTVVVKPEESSGPKSKHAKQHRDNSSEMIVKGLIPRVPRKIKQSLMQVVPVSIIDYVQGIRTHKMIGEMEKRQLNGSPAKDFLPDSYLRLYENYLQELVSYLKTNDIVPILCTYPTLIARKNVENFENQFLSFRRFSIEFSIEGMIDISQKIDQATKRIAMAHTVQLIDCNKALDNNPDYFSDPVHYTETGAKLVAQTIYNYLITL